MTALRFLVIAAAVTASLSLMSCQPDVAERAAEDKQEETGGKESDNPAEEVSETDAFVISGEHLLPLKKYDGYYEGTVNLTTDVFTVKVADKVYGFTPYSGAGGVGIIADDSSALPYYNLKNTASILKYDVDRATGLMSEGGKPFSFNMNGSAYASSQTGLEVRVTMPSDASGSPTYHLALCRPGDPDVIFDENFSLCTCGGDFLGAYQYGTLAGSASLYDGLAPGQKGGAKGNVTADGNEMFDYPVAVNSTVANEAYMKNRGLQDWTFCRASERPVSIQIGQVKDGVNYEAYAQTPRFSKISGTENVCLHFDIARYSTASLGPIYVDIKGDGTFSQSCAVKDGLSGYGSNTSFSNGGKRFTLGCASWTPPTVANADIDKPVSHYKLFIQGATASTAVRFTATAGDNGLARFFLLGVRVTREKIAQGLIGQPLPEWSEGCLDIHAVNTGLGECTFFIMPDGTTMCVDAGEIAMNASRGVPCRPNSSTRPYVTYANYMKHFMKPTGHDKLDYMQISHFHIDHMGTFQGNTYSKHPEGAFTVSGFTGIYTILPFCKLVDRAYSKDDPEYKFIYETGTSGTISVGAPESYAKFVQWASTAENGGLQVERFVLGTDRQLAMKYRPSAYPDFRIVNYCMNGSYWDGAKVVRAYAETQISENMNSCGFLLSYGKFDYWTAGDSGTQGKVADLVGKSIGRPVDAMKSNHHMSSGCMNASQLSVLQPTTVVTQSFYIRDDQPNQPILKKLCDNSIYVGEKFHYFTNIMESVAKEGTPYYNAVDLRGHVVIRVAPGGDSYYVYTLDDTDSQYRVKSITGPLMCK